MEYTPDGPGIERVAEWKERLTNHVKQMMFVSGETAEASPETTGMIEEIVRQQVIEMVSSCLFPQAAPLTINLARPMHSPSEPPRFSLNTHRRPDLPHPP
jgi:hypothetical protein